MAKNIDIAAALRSDGTAGDELIYVMSGELVLVTDDAEEVLHAGDCVGFKAGDPNAHHFRNRASGDVVRLEIGTRAADGAAHYADIDMITIAGEPGYFRRGGTPHPEQRRT